MTSFHAWTHFDHLPMNGFSDRVNLLGSLPGTVLHLRYGKLGCETRETRYNRALT